jgi:ATP-binding protein involved in chromosome partitioning
LNARLAEAGIAVRPVFEIESRIPNYVADPKQRPLPEVGNVIAVASGKGGVGKSTVAANLALALAAQGARVGLLDADIYGPSQPRMMGLAGQRPTTTDGRTLEPPRGHGIPVMSIGFLIDAEQPMAWRGPMVTQALTQMLADTHWGALDYLVVDMPPGTGDIQLTLTQRVPVSGAVIVTTPQEIALLDARKGLQMFRKVGVPVLGIVENMGLHRCPACGHESHVFDSGGGAALAERYQTRLLCQLPLDGRIREQADSGRPTVVADPGSAVAAVYQDIARRAAGALAASAIQGGASLPTITIEEDA